MSLLDDYKDGWLENLKRPTMMNCVSSVCFHFLIHPELLTIDDEDNETAIKIQKNDRERVYEDYLAIEGFYLF